MTQKSGKPEDEKAEGGKAETGAPEVEAEVVEEAEGASSAAFDETSPEIEEALAGAEEELAPKKSTLTPGVILFFAFAAVALAAFFIWWRQSGDEQRAVEEATESAPPAETEEAGTEIETGQPPAPADEEPAQETPPPSLPEPGGKIANEPKSGLRPPDETPSQEDQPFLPPVSERGAEKTTNTIDAGAEEASRRMQENEKSAASEEDQQTEEAAGFDIASPEEEALEEERPGQAPAQSSEQEPQRTANADAAVTEAAPIETGAGEAANIPAKIVNDLEALRGQTARLESALAEERARNADLAAEIRELRQGFETALAARDERYAEELSDMRASLQKIQNSEVKGATDQLRANLALNALRRKVEAGEPFADELTTMAEFAPERASELAPHAHSGVPTDTALRESFGAAARQALAAAGQEEAGDGVSGVIARAKSLVSVRPAAPQAGDSPRAIISRAEHAVDEGDLTYALNELDSLPASAKAAMAEWVKNAQANNDAQLVLGELSARLNSNGSE